MATRKSSNGGAPVLDAPAETEQEVAPELLGALAEQLSAEVATNAADNAEIDADLNTTHDDNAAALDIATAVEQEDITKGQRVYEDVVGCPRVPTASGLLAVVQRERRADGTQGEYMLCAIRPPKDKAAPESIQRASIAQVQELKSALESAGVTLFT
jgi:hypothetical protein